MSRSAPQIPKGASRMPWRALLLSCGFALTGCSGPPARYPPPNLVLICIDTLRADHLGAYGYDRETSPTLDRLAREGSVFSDALSTSNWTVPAVASIFTSMPPSRHGAGVTGEVRRLQEGVPPRQVPSAMPTLSKVLSRIGYRTAILAANPFLYGRFKDGFETAVVERTDARTLTDRAIAWLLEFDQRPSFLYLHYMDAHQPNRPPDPYFQFFAAADAKPHDESHGDWSYGQVRDLGDVGFQTFRDHRVATYDGSIRFVDAEISRLLSSLEHGPYRDRTVVVVTSDHGEEFWDHAIEQADRADDPRQIWGVGHGHTFYRELLHVPLIFHGPGIERGLRDPCPTSLLDVAPTLVALTSITELTHAQGEDLRPRLRGQVPSECGDRPRVASSPAYGANGRALVVSNWKLIESVGRQPNLFRLDHDPLERNDLATTDRRQLRHLMSQIRVVDRMKPAAGGEQPPANSELDEELRALGYL